MANAESTMVEHRLDTEGADPLLLAGVNDQNMRELARTFGIRVVHRGDYIMLSGEMESVEDAVPVAEHLIELARLRVPFDANDVVRFKKELEETGEVGGWKPSREIRIALPGSKKVITPKSDGQQDYLGAISEHDIVIGIGPAGTGKTYLAVAAAVDALYKKRVKRIILARPAVEAGENLGFLPGDLQEKVDPYLRPLYDALEDMMPPEKVQRAIEARTIEIAPLAYMRGRTLSDAFVILDEAQNATTAQMKMFLTRLGLNSRVVITGDKTQIDLPRADDSGLLEIERVLKEIDGISFIYLEPTDVIRHRLVKDIIRAYAAAGEPPPPGVVEAGEEAGEEDAGEAAGDGSATVEDQVRSPGGAEAASPGGVEADSSGGVEAGEEVDAAPDEELV